MNLNQISIKYERKVNLGDYNGARVEIALWAYVEEGDDPELATNALREMARNHCIAELSRFYPKIEAKVEELFMGLPVSVSRTVDDTEPQSGNDQKPVDDDDNDDA